LVQAFNKLSGELIWKSNAGLAGYAAPILFKEKEEMYLLVYHGKGLSCIKPENGQEVWIVPWEFEMNATTPAVKDNIVFITSFTRGGQALEINQDSYTVLWENDAIGAHHSDPIIIDGLFMDIRDIVEETRLILNVLS